MQWAKVFVMAIVLLGLSGWLLVTIVPLLGWLALFVLCALALIHPRFGCLVRRCRRRAR